MPLTPEIYDKKSNLFDLPNLILPLTCGSREETQKFSFDER